MPNIKSAGKRAKQAEVRRLKNRSAKSVIGTKRRLFVASLETKEKDKAMAGFKAFCSVLDKSAKRGIIKKNTADRRKSRAAAMLAKMA
jgi:small subunit ribosomal protein S20